MIKKQVMLGAGLMTAGAIMMAAILKQPKEDMPAESQNPLVQTAPVAKTAPESNTPTVPMGEQGVPTPEVQPLTVDVSTETEVLKDKEQQRQEEAEQAEAESREIMAQKHAAEDLAMQQMQHDGQEEDDGKVAANLQVKTRPESVQLAEQQARVEQEKAKQAELKKAQETQKAEEAKKTQEQKRAEEQKAKQAEALKAKKAEEAKKAQEQKKAEEAKKAQELKAKQDKERQEKEKQERVKQEQKPKTAPHTYVVQTGDTLIRLSKEYNIPVSAIAEANNMGRHDPLQRGRTIKLPTAKEVKELQAAAAKREQERLAKVAAEQKREAINERLAEARREAKKQGINDNYAVQVALATDQAKADEVANGYKKAGYSKVRTVKEARGVRVIVGTERSKEAAIALKDKINNDPSVKADGAWVIQSK